MLFSSPVFLFLFLPLLLAVYWIAPQRLKNTVLVAASLWFYAWGEPSLVVVMLVSIAMNWLLALRIDRLAGDTASRGILALAVCANLGLLIYFKYAVFLIENLNGLLAIASVGPIAPPDVVMPIGISFYTFQAMSYVVDVYRRQVSAERNPLNVALYISLFPQLIAGPIVRYIDIAEQIRGRRVTLSLFAEGVQRFTIGLAKKMLIANAAAAVADAVFDIPDAQLGTAVAWLGIVCYTLQIYFDFSGYSDMAIGLGLMFGFRFLENFNYPYIAQSLTEFWRRWHISLSGWFRDYLYIPLGGNRRGSWATYRNLLIVFALCGLWHGASWSFLAWGLFHGGFLVVERCGFGRVLEHIPAILRHAYLLLVVMIGWVFFRADDLPHAATYLAAMAGMGAASTREFHVGLWLDSGLSLVLIAGSIGSLPWPAWARERRLLAEAGAGWSAAVQGAVSTARLAVVALLLLASASSMLAGTHNPFIYFRF
jgi:alginate O-acetyltransferase complex protein AlgI